MFTFYFINVFNNWRPAYLLQIGITYYIIFLTIPVIRNLCIPETVVIQWFAEYSVKIDCIIRFPVTISPTASFRSTLHPATNGVFIFNLNVLGSGSASNPSCQINLDTGLRVGRIGKPENTTM